MSESSSRREFEKTWEEPRRLAGTWFATVNNRPIGQRFMVASFVFFALAGLLALVMRIQLAVPDNDFIGPEVYNQLFTMHGSTMMYLVILPFIEGMAILLLPAVIGSREMAYPRMSAFSFWVFFSGGLVFFSSFLFNAVPDAGWFVYPPLSGSKYSGLGMDFLLVGLAFIEIAGIGAGIEIAVTILKCRAPGMSLARMPLFAWAWLVTSFMIIFAFSALLSATVLIEMDRAIGTGFFDPDRGGNVLLWQHLFWFFGHPDVYIMFLPATGMISMIVPTFARRPIAGYRLIAVAILVTGFMSFGLWVHHMFTTGLPPLSMGFFVAASMVIALATGIQVFAWIATLWRRRPALHTPMLFVCGFFFIFVLGGLTGVMVAVLPFDLQAHDTHFVVAHFHYVLIGGVIFPILAAVHYWFPLIAGKMMNERLGRWSFWLIFTGFNVSFFPMHISGLMGMARRVYTYPESLGIGGLNMLSTVGAFIVGAGFVLAAWNVYYSIKKGAKPSRNPWNSGSLEWAVDTEMPNYVFIRPPVVYGGEPLWNSPKEEERDPILEKLADEMEALPAEYRATLITDAVSGRPQAVQRVAGPGYLPAIAALGLLTTSIATLARFYIVALGALIFTLLIAVKWLRPDEKTLRKLRESEVGKRTGLTLEPTGPASSGWWAVLGVLAVVGTVFGVLFYSYFYLRLYSPEWPQDGLSKPDAGGAFLLYLSMPFGAWTCTCGKRAVEKSEWRKASVLLFLSAALCAFFLAYTIRLSAAADFPPSVNAYASIFHVILWHMAVLTAGVLASLAVLAAGIFQNGRRPASGYLILQAEIAALFFSFSAAVSILIYLIVHLSPHWI